MFRAVLALGIGSASLLSMTVADKTITTNGGLAVEKVYKCITKMDTTFVHPNVPTTASEITISDTITALATSTPPTLTVTVNPANLNDTATYTESHRTTVTSEAQNITDGTFRTTTTLSFTGTETSTITITPSSIPSIVIRGTTTVTTTMAAPPNYAEIATSIFNYAEPNGPPLLTDIDDFPTPHRVAARDAGPSDRNIAHYTYPSYVACIASIYSRSTALTIHILATPTMTVPALPTARMDCTTTLTLTSTSWTPPPGSYSTQHFTKSERETRTRTVTTTITPTSTLSTLLRTVRTTEYPACQSANVLGPKLYNGDWTAHATYSDDAVDVWHASAMDGRTCCEACHDLDNGYMCQFSMFSVKMGMCYNVGLPKGKDGEGECDAGREIGTFFQTRWENDVEGVFANGRCGMLRDGGNV